MQAASEGTVTISLERLRELELLAEKGKKYEQSNTDRSLRHYHSHKSCRGRRQRFSHPGLKTSPAVVYVKQNPGT
jgi:CRISPR/Cas system Type II protein with McrA/HNH and RuvC-like nuclease domain